MSDFLRHVPFDVPEPVRRFLQGDIGPWLRVEEFSDGSAWVIRAELPGVDPERDIDISVSGRTLTIEGRREEESENQGKDNYRSEFRYGEFSRSFQLPAAVSEEEIQASYTGGILEVRVPVAGHEETPRRKVRVNRTDTYRTAADAGGEVDPGTSDAGAGDEAPPRADFFPGDQPQPDSPQQKPPADPSREAST
ncbi:Hsp20/alpha crystallin family protein [Arthrobacter sp. efr-133-R2A-63]|uniref:Hsp20/alpha crystallin family protein n=1 Tax=Arthrobacter sp. efr-133-R2A-63 TaxID=3040278 RepID=UPI00254E917B|nr:Hsp20/alpha crystallin family protein [Arthrobacter sp. efr-133-R2A-63]